MENTSESFDVNKIAVEFINSNINEIMNIGKDIFKDTKEAIQIKLKTGYTDYLKNLYERYGKSKSFFIIDEPQFLNSFYVPVGLESSQIKIKTANLRAILGHNRKSIISGTAGSGKSILLKHLLINALTEKKQVPVFIELRDCNSTELSLFETIKNTFECFGLDLDSKFIEKAFSHGQFLLLLDGLDEVNSDKREILVKQIDDLIKEYSKNSIIITSRPDNLTTKLQSFSIFYTLPLSIEQCIKLIEKIPADENIKSKFISDLKESLYKKHTSFLSNPLLLTIMILTYGYSTDIPNKLSIFYNQAYEALFQRHDTRKGAYKRIRKTKLDIQDFEKVLNVFCIQTYDKRKIQFSRQEAIGYIDNSKQILDNNNFVSEAFLDDLLQSVCILIEDGLFITFTHRSFQEYFAARFIVSSDFVMRKRLLEQYQFEIIDDNVFKLVHELDSAFVEYEIIYPFLVNLFDKIGLKGKVGPTHFYRYCSLMWTSFYFSQGTLYGTMRNTENTNYFVHFILNIISPNLVKDFITNKSTDWIIEQKAKSTHSDEHLEYDLDEIKYNNIIIKELYKSESYFSKRIIELLIRVKKDLEQKRQSKTEKLEEFLFSKK